MAHPLTARELTRQAVQQIQRLCLIRLSSQAIAPELLNVLGRVIPAQSSTVFWADSKMNLASIYAQGPEVGAIAPLYLGEFCGRREREVVLTFSEVMEMKYASPVGDFYDRVLKVSREEFLKSDLYNLVMLPMGTEQSIQVKLEEHGKALASLQLNRLWKEPAFSEREVRVLAAIAPFIAHAIAGGDEIGRAHV